MKKVLIITILVVVGALVFAGGTAENAAQTKDRGTVHFAILFGDAGLGDNGYNDEVYEGCMMAVNELGATFDYVEPTNISEYEIQLRAFADAGEYDVIIAISSNMVDPLEMIATDYPDQRFCMIDTTIEGFDNIHSLTAYQPEQHFLSGVIAGLVTQDPRFKLANDKNILGFCIAIDSPTSNAQASGFLAGAKYINPSVQFLTSYIGGYNDPSAAKELATTMYERGADIVSTNSGASALGVFNAAREQNKYVIGTSLAMVDKDHSLCTSMKYVQQMVMQECKSIIDGTWKPGADVYGIKDGICNYSLEGVGTEIPEDIIAKVEEVKKLIVDGSLVLPEKLTDIDAWVNENSPYVNK